MPEKLIHGSIWYWRRTRISRAMKIKFGFQSFPSSDKKYVIFTPVQILTLLSQKCKNKHGAKLQTGKYHEKKEVEKR